MVFFAWRDAMTEQMSRSVSRKGQKSYQPSAFSGQQKQKIHMDEQDRQDGGEEEFSRKGAKGAKVE